MLSEHDKNTLGWGKFFSVLDEWQPGDKGSDDDCFESPTSLALKSASVIVSLAVILVTEPVASRLVPDGSGGLAFEYWDDETGFKTMHVDREGKITCREYNEDGKLICCVTP